MPVAARRSDGLKKKGVGVGVVGFFATDLLAEEGADVDDLGGKALAGEQFPGAGHTELVPMIFFDGLYEVLRDLIHVEETDAETMAGDTAKFHNGGLQAFEGEMLEEVMNEAKVEGLGGGGDFEDVADFEPYVGKKGAGVLDVGFAKVQAGVIEVARDPVSMEEAVIVGRAASGFEDGGIGRLVD